MVLRRFLVEELVHTISFLSVIFMNYFFFKKYLMISHLELSTVADNETVKRKKISILSSRRSETTED